MEVVKRICKKDTKFTDDFSIKRGKEYITSLEDERGCVTIFSSRWVYNAELETYFFIEEGSQPDPIMVSVGQKICWGHETCYALSTDMANPTEPFDLDELFILYAGNVHKAKICDLRTLDGRPVAGVRGAGE